MRPLRWHWKRGVGSKPAAQTVSVPEFEFAHHGRLIDHELELVAPEYAFIDEVLAAARHPRTIRDDFAESLLTRAQLVHFLQACPHGHQPADLAQKMVPTYHFWMYRHGCRSPARPATVPCARAQGPVNSSIAGGISLRVGVSADIIMYYGHVGYHVYPMDRGRNFAERSVRLLLPLARRHGMTELWITCNPDNLASRRTCERLEAELIETVAVPPQHALYHRGEVAKCRYRLAL